MKAHDLSHLDTDAPKGYCRCKLNKKELASDIARVVREKAGFEKVNRFCFAPGFAPADVEHYIVYPTDPDGKCR
jgi:hypothetical protein